MEEARETAAQQRGQSSQLLSVNFTAKQESHSPAFPGAQRVFPDKPTSSPLGNLQTSAQGAPIPALASSHSLKLTQQNEIRRGLSPLKPANSPTGRDLSSVLFVHLTLSFLLKLFACRYFCMANVRKKLTMFPLTFSFSAA